MDRVQTYIDKSSWGDGPWQQEPDRIEFRDEATNLPCLMRRNSRLGNWCGYVAVLPGHPAYAVKASVDVDVHGGLTFGPTDCDGDTALGICHVPEPGEPDNVHWLGFDCGHSFDLAPGFAARERELGLPPFRVPITYRDVAYVKAECASLARQLSEMKK